MTLAISDFRFAVAQQAIKNLKLAIGNDLTRREPRDGTDLVTCNR
jgi:hypothetical protein